jgi:hypothetical protein
MADQTEKILLQLELDVSQTITNLEKAKAALSTFKTEQANLNAELKKLEDAGQKGSVAFQNLERQLIANKAAQQNSTTEVRNYEKQLRLAIAANESQIGSNDQLKAQLSILTAEWNALAAAGRENTDEGKALATAIDLSTQKLNEQEQSVGNFKRQVGDYGVVAKSLKTQIREATNEATILSQKFGENSKAAVDSARKVAALREEYDDFNKRVAALNPENKIAAFGQVASGIAGGFAAAQGAMAIFGKESDDVGKALVKIQAALAISQGIKQVAELGDSFKSLQLILFGATAAKQADNVVTAEGAVVTSGATVSLAGFATAEGVAAAASSALGAALNLMMGPLGLILLAVGATVAAFKIFGDDSKEDVEALGEELEILQARQERELAIVKERSAAQITESENSLSLAKAKGEGIEKISSLEQNLLNVKLQALDDEKKANDDFLQKKSKAYDEHTIAIANATDEDNKKKLQDEKDTIAKELVQLDARNTAILNEQKKLDTDLAIAKADAEQKQVDQLNRISNLRISLIKDDRQKELAAEKQAVEEKLQQLKKDEVANATEISLIRQQSAQKANEINLKFDQQELKEKNQLEIALTKEGSLERIQAETKAATTEAEIAKQIAKGKSNQILLIEADLSNKLRELEDQRLAIIEEHNQQELDLELRKQQAKIAIEKSDALNDPTKQLAARLNEINFTTQAAIDAKEREADELKATAQREITDHEQLQQRIKGIDEAIAEEKLAILGQSSNDIINATREANDARLQAEKEFKQLEIDASSDNGETLQLQLDQINLEEQSQKEHAERTISDKIKLKETLKLIDEKYDKIRTVTREQATQSDLRATADVLGRFASLSKEGGAAYRTFASAQTVISTYAAATAALSIPPLGLGPVAGIPLAVATIAQGLANLGRINGVQFYEGGYDSPSGYTGDGHPMDVAVSHSTPRRTVHKKEYIIDHSTLALPHVASFVSNVIEPTRLRKSNYTNRASMAGGGFSDTFFVANAGNSGISEENITASVEATVSNMMKNLPAIVVSVEDINIGQDRVAKVIDRVTV